jgi:arabinan endo-1,5-alpha-L-arabinosidase
MAVLKKQMVNYIFIIVMFLFYAFSAAAQGTGDPTNNLTGSDSIHDPSSVIKCGSTYYVYGTGGGSKYSTDRIFWTSGPNIMTGTNGVGTQTWWAAHGGQIWAPEIAYMNGLYYCFYSVSAWMNFNSAIGVATNTTLDSKDTNYKWVDKGLVIDSLGAADGGGMVNVIDPGTFVDNNGKWYLAFGSFQKGCRLIELNKATGKPVNNPPHPTIITNSLGEASFIFHWKNYYYYVVSRGGCCNAMSSTYQIVYGRAASVTGPYMTKPTSGSPNGQSFQSGNYTLLLTRDSLNGSVLHAGMGGQAFFWDHDTLFMDYHAYTAPNGTSYLNIKPMYADSLGWLTMNPAKGKIITGAPTAIVNTTPALSHSQFSVHWSKFVRCIGDGKKTSDGIMYTITGQRISGKTAKYLPKGIYLEKSIGR